MAMHKMQQRQLPLVLIAADLPILPGLAGASKSYAERSFSFPTIGPLPEQDAIKALQDPARQAGVAFEPAALDEIFRITKGYPYFLQEWGYQAWNHAAASPISLAVIRETSDLVARRLDENFFRVRFDRLTPREKIPARHGGTGPRSPPYRRCGRQIGRQDQHIGNSPSHGDMAFTVPLFDEFMLGAIPHLS